MLNLMTAHGLMDLTLACDGDIDVDGHHSVEDIGITLGQAFKQAIGDKKGIRRYGTFYLPMDEALAFVSLDISGRPFLVYDDGGEMAPMIGGYDTELTEEFLRAFAVNAGITLHVRVLYGKNSHHKVEPSSRRSATPCASPSRRTRASTASRRRRLALSPCPIVRRSIP